MSYLLARYYLYFAPKWLPALTIFTISDEQDVCWCLGIISFLETPLAHTLAPVWWHFWNPQCFPCPAFAHLPGMFPFFHLHLHFPGHISFKAIFWPKPDVSTSFFEPHKVACLYLFWHLALLIASCINEFGVFSYLFPSPGG